MTEKAQVGQDSLPPTTTLAEDVTSAGQRRINILWEVTQSIVALSITGATIYCEINKINSQIITAGFFLVVGVYLQRTNHNNIGGVGGKPTEIQPYVGR